MDNDYNLLLNDIVSKILALDVECNQVKIYVQKYQDFDLLLKLNHELLNHNSDCDVIFYLDEIGNINDTRLNIEENKNKNIYELSNFPFDLIISDLAFIEDEHMLKSILNCNYSKLLLTLSSTFFDEKYEFLEILNNRNYFKSIISLPIYKNDSNMLILTFDSTKTSNDLLIIDESDSLNHKIINDWSFIAEDLSEKILDSYKNFREYENAIMVPISRVIQEKSIFGNNLGNYILEDPLKNYTKKRVVSSDVVNEISSSGATIDTKAFENNPNFSFKELIYGKKRQDLSNLLIKGNEKLFDDEVKIKELWDLVNLKEIKKKSPKESLLLATCKDCTSDLVFNHFDVDEFKEGESYIQIKVISKEILPEYLKVYLNSANGLNEIFYFTKGDKFITVDKIKNVRVPIPSKNIQKDIVKASQEANKFFKEIDLLKKEFSNNIFDYENMLNAINDFKGSVKIDEDEGTIEEMSRNWWHVYKGLVWPLAISYLFATRGKSTGVGKLDNYLILFEFIAAFNFIILLSGLPKNVYQKFKKEIWNNTNLYKNMSFGTWVVLSQKVSKIYKNEDFISVLDEEFIKKITSDRIFNILEEIKDIRNSKHHGSVLVEKEANEIISKLDIYLEDIFDILEVYSEYDLIYFTGDMKIVKEGFNHQIILLNGPFEQPVYDNLILSDSLKYSHSLYLYHPKNNKILLINDDLMKFVATDKYEKHWGLFIYSGWKNENHTRYAFYKCFQSKEDDLNIEIKSFKDNIIR